jgi:cytidylate kinase
VPKFVVTICAPDSCGGGVIVPAVAERLGVPHQPLSSPRSVPGGSDDAPEDGEFRRRSEREIEGLHAGGGVIRDGAAALLLASDPNVLRVRLYGSFDARVRQGVEASGKTEAETRSLLEQRDSAWAAFYRSTYDIDVADAYWYHMLLDSTMLDWDLCADVIAHAARALR